MGQEGDFAWLQRKTTPRAYPVLLERKRRRINNSIPDVLTHARLQGKKKVHQTEKPVELLMDLLKFSTNPGDTVLDPFAGSFSLGMAAMLTGRYAVGIELSKEFLDAGFDRLKNTLGFQSPA